MTKTKISEEYLVHIDVIGIATNGTIAKTTNDRTAMINGFFRIPLGTPAAHLLTMK